MDCITMSMALEFSEPSAGSSWHGSAEGSSLHLWWLFHGPWSISAPSLFLGSIDGTILSSLTLRCKVPIWQGIRDPGSTTSMFSWCLVMNILTNALRIQSHNSIVNPPKGLHGAPELRHNHRTTLRPSISSSKNVRIVSRVMSSIPPFHRGSRNLKAIRYLKIGVNKTYSRDVTTWGRGPWCLVFSTTVLWVYARNFVRSWCRQHTLVPPFHRTICVCSRARITR